MLVEQVLDLDHGDVFSAADDHVLGAPGDADVALFAHARQIACGEPAVGVDAIEFRALQVADKQAGAADHQVSLAAAR
ncbi:hypothetical protein D3C71_2057780 [compost metagenome]